MNVFCSQRNLAGGASHLDMNLSDFFYMGGYAAFLWPAYGLVLSVLVYNVWSARRAHQEARRAAVRRLQMEETRS